MNQTVTMILGFTLPCLMTTLGAALVFFFNKTSRLVNMITIGLAAGIMLSASIWSLLIPALENAQESMGDFAFLPVVLGFLFGALFMVFLDFLCEKCMKKRKKMQKNLKNHENLAIFGFAKERSQLNFKSFSLAVTNTESVEKAQKRTFSIQSREKQKAWKLFTAITIHNIPEGLSVGFAIGTSVALHTPLLAAVMFALGIAIQNFPEGLATALPLQKTFKNRTKSFIFATLSGVVEPVFAILGFFLAAYITSLLPWLLAFSAGAMIYVIIEEMVPEIHMDGVKSFGTWAFVLGFVVMMILDICL